MILTQFYQVTPISSHPVNSRSIYMITKSSLNRNYNCNIRQQSRLLRYNSNSMGTWQNPGARAKVCSESDKIRFILREWVNERWCAHARFKNAGQNRQLAFGRGREQVAFTVNPCRNASSRIIVECFLEQRYIIKFFVKLGNSAKRLTT
ncbi:hypothetical protein TNCV_2372331 [Trichonephila clavipes]|nr:hypothetical protein TNCV_2372331 [Trichonephila clavipes]